jgi:phosphoribosylaminoimidazole-succinocarboxamide synthase
MSNIQLSTNLSLAEMIRSESAKRKGITNNPTPEHIENMKAWALNIFQPIRDHFKIPILISSGYRSKELNKAIGGSQTSQHSKGEAGDLDMDGTSISNRELFLFIKDNLEFDQLIWEFGTKANPDWVHVSFNPKGNQRKQVLIAKKYAGKTTYLNY